MPSSAILAMQYMPAEQELYLAFRSRQVYRYSAVPMEEWREFLGAQSKGTYLNQVFKFRDHPYEPVAGPIPPVPPDSDEPLEWGETWALRKKDVRSVQVDRLKGKLRA